MNPIRAVLFDRDGTLVEDVPYNGDPDRVRPVQGAREALRLLRGNGIGTGVVTNQSGVARGLISTADVRRVDERVDELLGPFDVWAVCPHGPGDGCHCRKPRPGLILWAAGRLCTPPRNIAVIGDIGSDMEAARRAGAHGILVPTPATRPEETAAADRVAPDLLTAVRALLAGRQQAVRPADEHPNRTTCAATERPTHDQPTPDRAAQGRPAPGWPDSGRSVQGRPAPERPAPEGSVPGRSTFERPEPERPAPEGSVQRRSVPERPGAGRHVPERSARGGPAPEWPVQGRPEPEGSVPGRSVPGWPERERPEPEGAVQRRSVPERPGAGRHVPGQAPVGRRSR